MAKVLFDSRARQARTHKEDGLRLLTLLDALRERAAPRVAFSADSALSADELRAWQVLIVTTRVNFARDAGFESAYTAGELDAICEFVRAGGGLLLMSNHADLSIGDYEVADHTRFDAMLAARFDVTIERTFFAHRENLARVGTQLQRGHQTLSTLSAGCLAEHHPIIRGADAETRVRSIVTNNGCSIRSPLGTGIVAWSGETVDWRNGLPVADRLFAHAIDGPIDVGPTLRGRVVTVADSGFIGSDGTTRPGPGLIGRGDNLQFVLNAVSWLAGERV